MGKPMSISEQFRAVHTVLKDHYPTLATKYAAIYPEYAIPKKDPPAPKKAPDVVYAPPAPTDVTPLLQTQVEFSQHLVDVIRAVIDEQRESYKDHLKEQRDLFERSDLTTAAAHKEAIKRLEDENADLRNRDRPWRAMAVVDSILLLALTAYVALARFGYVPPL